MDFVLFFCSVLVSLKSLIIILYEYVICAGGARVHCQESGEESSETESVYSLKCHISQEVNHLHEGLKHALKSELEKASPSLGRSAIYLKESHINGLPRYLTVQFVRFFWKRESNQKAKILRKVDYPLELDIYDLCSDDLRKKLEAPRKILRDEEGKKLGLKASEKSSGSKDNDVKMSDAEGSSNRSGEPSKATSEEGVPSDSGTQMTGIYDLVAVLTHKGRSADSGHYVAWVKQESGKWIEFDDDSPIAQREEDITKLSGGGDWHMAYICMYKARVLPK
ncbi:ubiquitin carboxyl-terminal hydrolase 6-like [Quercus lobata]|uniref:ubiquitin carboxyl-terminal hydrolase 6-like n=1 Tax=Quercus lobata TaxID=97700 RepID=UPI00124705A1|nr:ubiquitin carboxyl-terminal hydrolase 6-like [Quercus lobata]